MRIPDVAEDVLSQEGMPGPGRGANPCVQKRQRRKPGGKQRDGPPHWPGLTVDVHAANATAAAAAMIGTDCGFAKNATATKAPSPTSGHVWRRGSRIARTLPKMASEVSRRDTYSEL